MRTFSLPALLACILFFPACNRGPGKDLAKSHAQLEELERRVFDRLVFTRSADVNLDSPAYRFLVDDQLGRRWMFKAGAGSAARGAVAAYRIYRLFGVETPETYAKTLTVNGRELSGTLQRYLPARRSMHAFSSFDLGNLTAEAPDYLAANHLLSWLLANHQVHPGSFLVRGERNAPATLVRVDLSIDWFLLGGDRLSISYVSPMLAGTPFAGYQAFFRAFLLERLRREGRLPVKIAEEAGIDTRTLGNLDLGRVAALARIVQAFPEDYYRMVLAPAAENECSEMANAGESTSWQMAPEILGAARCEDFLRLALARKSRIAGDYSRFLREELRLGNSGGDERAVASGILRFHATKKEELARDLAALENAKGSPGQGPLEVPISFTAHQALQRLAKIGHLSPDRRPMVIDWCQARLERILETATHPMERAAIGAALANVRSLKTCEDDADFPWHALLDLNRIFRPGWISQNSGKCRLTGPE